MREVNIISGDVMSCINLTPMQRCEVSAAQRCKYAYKHCLVCGCGGFSNITVNYNHTDSTLNDMPHNTNTFGPVYVIVPHSNGFSFCVVGFVRKQEELIVHISTVRDMQIETVANGISTISSLVSVVVAKH